MKKVWIALIALLAGIVLMPNAAAQRRQIRSVQTFTNYDLDSTSFVYNDAGGTGANDGWIVVATETNRSMMIEINQLNVTGGIDFRIEARLQGGDQTAVIIWPSTPPQNLTTTGGTLITFPEDVYQVRMGMKIGTADDGDDLTVNAEDITITYESYDNGR